jgi:hypothetical protein
MEMMKKQSGLVAVLLALFAAGIGIGYVVNDDESGHHRTVTVSIGKKAVTTPAEAALDVKPPVSEVDAGSPGGLAPSAEEIPGVAAETERQIDRQNNIKIDDQTYDVSGVLSGGTAKPGNFDCYTPMHGQERPYSQIGLGVVHVTVSLNVKGPADGKAICTLFHNVKLSSTWIVDNEANSWNNVQLKFNPWTQAWWNQYACSIEFIGSTGRPGEGPAQWTNAQLREGARLMTRCFKLAGIPIRVGKVTSGGHIIQTGVIFHQELGTLGGGHRDPGPYFNRTLFLQYMREFAKQNDSGVTQKLGSHRVAYLKSLNARHDATHRRIRHLRCGTTEGRRIHRRSCALMYERNKVLHKRIKRASR